MRIACVQLEAHGVEEAERALDDAVAMASEAARDADLVVLPEATYPAYILHEAEPHLDLARYQAVLEAFAGVAREHETWLVVGLVRPVGRELANSAVLLDPEGRTSSVVDKSFLWHFDRRWFRRGIPGDVAALPDAAIGMFVCADARMTEIPRRLALAGARVLIDSTALVLSPLGTNAQLEYMLAARAWENGAFLAVANKCGVEAGIARYGGRSAIFDPSGARLVEATVADAEIIATDVDPAEAPGPRAAPSGGIAAGPADALPISDVLRAGPPAAPLRLAMLRPGVTADRLARELDADLGIGRSVADGPEVLSIEDDGFRLSSRTYAAGEVAPYRDAIVGFLAGDQLAAPEDARSLMLRGASLLAWDAAGARIPDEVLRTRADENRVFLVAVEDDDQWRVYGPSGTLLGEGPVEGLDAVFVELPLALAWNKEMAPGSHVVLGRPQQ